MKLHSHKVRYVLKDRKEATKATGNSSDLPPIKLYMMRCKRKIDKMSNNQSVIPIKR